MTEEFDLDNNVVNFEEPGSDALKPKHTSRSKSMSKSRSNSFYGRSINHNDVQFETSFQVNDQITLRGINEYVEYLLSTMRTVGQTVPFFDPDNDENMYINANSTRIRDPIVTFWPYGIRLEYTLPMLGDYDRMIMMAISL